MELACFTFGPFAENTYIIHDGTECIIIDPGSNAASEHKVVTDYITGKNLVPTILLNTHCHIDHVLGNSFMSDKYGLDLWAHEGEVPVLEACTMVSQMYQIPYDASPAINHFIQEGDEIGVGSLTFKVLFTPGHSPASISLYCSEHKTLIAGDVLFRRSIGRTDLPGGNYDTLISSIKTQFFTLPEETIVYSGHGPSTTIGEEMRENPFLQD